MKIINCTPHDVHVCDENGRVTRTYRASGFVARVTNDWETVEYIDGLHIVERTNLRVVGLPRPREDTLYIVSNVMLDYCTDRTDLIAPAMQVKVNGRVIGARSFVRGARWKS